jgi:TusE/DsrC/DsvC family sulfur relay protein
MTVINEKGISIQIDEDGFLVDTEKWTEETARILAGREGIDDLTEEQLAIVIFLRDYYRKFEAFPILNYVCKNLKQPRNCMNEEFINPMKAWKIAGLPKPEGIHFVSVDSGHKHFIMEECC